jgi:type IV pilus assembly protein PilA
MHALLRRRAGGFTWIEMLLVVAVLGALGLMAIPALQDNALKRQVKDGLALADVAKRGVQAAYSALGDMPADNKVAGIPDHDKIVGTFVKDVNVAAGAITLTYGNSASKVLDGMTVTIRPAVVPGEPLVPIAWLCHLTATPAKMEVRGDDITSIPTKWLPLECRTAEAK